MNGRTWAIIGILTLLLTLGYFFYPLCQFNRLGSTYITNDCEQTCTINGAVIKGCMIPIGAGPDSNATPGNGSSLGQGAGKSNNKGTTVSP